MIRKYEEYSHLFKALSDPNRLMIVDMLSCGELCACVILEEFSITQPTLSHHMKILCDSEIVKSRKEGKWMYYSLNEKTIQTFKNLVTDLTAYKEKGFCYSESCCEVVENECK